MSEREALAALQSVVRSVVRVCRDETIRGLLEVALADAEAIAEKPSPEAIRKRRERTRGDPDSPGQSRSVTVSPGHAVGGLGGSLSSDQIRDSERERESAEREVTDSPGQSGTVRTMPTIAPTPRLIDPRLRIDEESRAYAVMLGIGEVELEWTSYVNWCVSEGVRSADFQARWRANWCPKARNRQRTDREKGRTSGVPVDNADPAVIARARELDRKEREAYEARLQREAEEGARLFEARKAGQK